MSGSENEGRTRAVYGDSFALYGAGEMERVIRPFFLRFEVNGVDPAFVSGANCLDAGCGGGRGSLFLARLGAARVTGVDLSPKNVETCRTWARRFDLAHLEFREGTLAALPFPDGAFDVVWCNGVIMHTEDPDAVLREIARVLRPGGRMWLYAYGAGGVYWRAIDRLRAWVRPVGLERALRVCRLATTLELAAKCADDWFVPRLRRYRAADLAARLRSLGLDAGPPLSRGLSYDTSERVARFGDRERAFMGEGDLRFLVSKTLSPVSAPSLPDADGRGSPFEDAPEVLRLDAPLAAVEAALSGAGPDRTILACLAVLSRLRRRLEADEPFDAAAHTAEMEDVARIVRDLSR